jgi:hypothetical protein
MRVEDRVMQKFCSVQIFVVSLLVGFVVLARGVAGQDGGIAMAEAPALPATAEENWVVKRFKIEAATSAYDTWKTERKNIAELPRGTIVSGLRKLSVVYEPDVITITAAMPQLGLKVGDTILRYTVEGEGFADFWVHSGSGGRWYKEFDGSFITEPDTNGCSKNCSGKVTKVGRKEVWANVRLQDGRAGWFREY